MMSKFLLFALATTAALTLAAAAQAEVLPFGYEQNSVTIRVDDLNLANDAGAGQALDRIAFAADHVCGKTGITVDLHQRVLHRACVSATVEHTLTELGNANVSGRYARAPQMTVAAYRGN
jgi:UrcA family protein